MPRKSATARKVETALYDNDHVDESEKKKNNSALPLTFPHLSAVEVQNRLRLWGVCGVRGLFSRYGLAALSETIEEVEAARNAAVDRGEVILSPGGLFRWTLYDSYGKR